MASELTVKEAADITGYTVDYIQDLAREGKVKARKIATVWLIDRKSLLGHLKDARARGEKPGRKKGLDTHGE